MISRDGVSRSTRLQRQGATLLQNKETGNHKADALSLTRPNLPYTRSELQGHMCELPNMLRTPLSAADPLLNAQAMKLQPHASDLSTAVLTVRCAACAKRS